MRYKWEDEGRYPTEEEKSSMGDEEWNHYNTNYVKGKKPLKQSEETPAPTAVKVESGTTEQQAIGVREWNNLKNNLEEKKKAAKYK